MATPALKDLPVVCCVPIASPRLSENEAEATASLFKALSDPHRVRIANLLARSKQPVCVCDITDIVGLSQPTVSFHLKKLAGSGLISREQRGTWAYYSINRAAMKRLTGIFNIRSEEK